MSNPRSSYRKYILSPPASQFCYAGELLQKAMRKLWLLLLLSSTTHCAVAQSDYPSISYQPHNRATTYDTVRYIVSYSYSTYRDPSLPTLRDEDEVWLEIGDSVTKSYSRPRWVNDSLVTLQVQRGASSYRSHKGWCQREEIICGYPKDTILWTYQELLKPTALYWYERRPQQAWELEEGGKEILGFPCKKATAHFRGRHYTAWYTPEIPLPYGPWSFHGLPGLILEIKDDTDRVSFVATGFNAARTGLPLVMYAGHYVKSTRAKARRAIDMMHRRPYAYLGEYAKHIFGDDWGPKTSYKHTWVELE